LPATSSFRAPCRTTLLVSRSSHRHCTHSTFPAAAPRLRLAATASAAAARREAIATGHCDWPLRLAIATGLQLAVATGRGRLAIALPVVARRIGAQRGPHAPSLSSRGSPGTEV